MIRTEKLEISWVSIRYDGFSRWKNILVCHEVNWDYWLNISEICGGESEGGVCVPVSQLSARRLSSLPQCDRPVGENQFVQVPPPPPTSASRLLPSDSVRSRPVILHSTGIPWAGSDPHRRMLWGRGTSASLVLVLLLGCHHQTAADKKLKQSLEKVLKKTSTEKPKLFTGKRPERHWIKKLIFVSSYRFW